jgi:Cu/Ag efflux protein CusF
MNLENCCCCGFMSGIRSAKPWTLLGIALLLVLFAGACASEPSSDTASDDPAKAENSMDYTVRGVLVSEPTPDGSSSVLRIQHESIPDMVGHNGEVSGMDAMTMQFATRDGLSVEELSVGDKIEFDLNIDWDSNPALRIMEIRPLTADTELVLAGDHG